MKTIYIITVGIMFKNKTIRYSTTTTYDILQSLDLYKNYPETEGYTKDEIEDVFLHFCVEISE